MTKIIVTGASGVLGSAIYNAFKSAHDPDQHQYEVVGLAHSRVSGELQQLDLLDEENLEKAFTSDFALREGDWVIHCAAERRADVAEKVFQLSFQLVTGKC
jgi:S-adenosylmethionine synthetase